MPRRKKNKQARQQSAQGKGEYQLSKALKKVAPAIRNAISGAAGTGLGAAATALTGSPVLGNLVHQTSSRGISRFLEQVATGSGPYTRLYHGNTVLNDLIKGSRTRFGHGLDEDTMITEGKLPIGEVVMPASGEMKLQIRVNPNILSLPEGRAFQEYQPELVIVEYESQIGQGTTGAEGMLTLYHVRNPNLQMPSDYVSAEKMGNSMTARLDEGILMGVECEGAPWLLNRESNSDVIDLSTTDFGYIGVHAKPSASFASQTIGRLYLHYRLKFRFTKFDSDFYAYAHVTSTSQTSASPFGTSRTIKTALGACLGLTMTANSITLPNAQVGQVFCLSVYWYHGATAAFTPPTVTLSNAEAYAILENGAKSTVTAPSLSVVSGQAFMQTVFRVTNMTPNSPTITISGVVLPSSPAWMDLVITPAPEGLSATDL